MPALKKRITIAGDSFQRTEYYLLFTYLLDGRTRFMEVERGEDVAELLQNNGMITRYEGAGKNLKMYVNKVAHNIHGSCEPPKWSVEVELEWSDIKFFPSDILHIVANHEYDLIGRVMGLIPYKPKGKCRSIETEYYQAA